MMRIKIYKGYVSHYKAGVPDVNSGLEKIKFSIGNPPVELSAWSMTGVSPLSYGGYFAVAGIPSMTQPSMNIAIAYRRLRGNDLAHAFNITVPILCMIFAVGVGLLYMTFNKIDMSGQLFLLATTALGMFGIWRILTIRRAFNLLNQLQNATSDQ